MNKQKALDIFYDYIKKDFSDVDVYEVDERDDGVLIKFTEKDDEFPVDYPVIYVDKDDEKVRELSYLSEEDSRLIFGDNNGKD